MGSRVREKVERLFEVFVEIAKPNGKDEEAPFIIQQYPPDFNDKEALMMIPKFAYPCPTDASKVDHFTFVLTDLDSMFRFGYCRHTTGHHTCLCIVSWLPWFEIFYKMLDLIADITNRSKKNSVTNFLRATYNHAVPLPQMSVTIVANEDMFNFTSPDVNKLPGIPGSRNLTEYFSAVDPYNMMVVFASMLHERRIYMTSKKLSRLTACIHAAEALLYPMHWQHLYIPVLPSNLIDYVSAPMPFLIGVHSNLVDKLKQNRVDVGDAVVVDLDANAVYTEYDDLGDLPEDVSSYLKRNLKVDVVKNNMKTGDTISMAFLNALVRLIGGYRDALKFRRGEPITFDPEAFVRSRSSQSTQAFLEGMLSLQIFQQFIYGRLEILNSGAGFRDLFEQQAILYADKLNSQSKYKEWLKSVKKSGKKGWRGLKVKMKEQGKRAMADFKTKFSGLTDNEERRGSNHELPTSPFAQRKSSKQRPVTTHAETMKRARPPRPPPPSRVNHRENEKRVKSVVQVRDGQEDSQLHMAYQRMDMNLMTDSDIQAAILASSGHERMEQNSSEDSDSRCSDSDEEEDGTSISFDVLQSSDEDDKVIPKNPAHHQLTAQQVTPSDSPHASPAAHMRASNTSSSLRPKSYTRFDKSFNSAALQDATVFDSSESDRTDTGSFDSLTKSAAELRDAPSVVRSVSAESLESRSEEVEIRPIQRDITSRVSLTRSKAFRREPPTIPLRANYLDDNDDLDGSRNNLDKDILVPMSDLRLTNNSHSLSTWETQHSVVNVPLSSYSSRRDTSDLLAHEWSLASLAKGPSIRLPIAEQATFPINPSNVGSFQNLPVNRKSLPSSSVSSTSVKDSMHNHQHSEARQTHNQRMSLDLQNNQSLQKRVTDVPKRHPPEARQPLDPPRLPNPAPNHTLPARYSSSQSQTSSILPWTPGTMNFSSPTPSSSTPMIHGRVQRVHRKGGLDSSFSSSSSSETNLLQEPDLPDVLDFELNKSLDRPKNLGNTDNRKISPSRPSQPDVNHKASPRLSQPYTNHKVSPSRPPQPDLSRRVLSLQPEGNHKVSPSRPAQLDVNHKTPPSRPPQPHVNLKVLPPIPSRPDVNSNILPAKQSQQEWNKFS